MAITKHAARPTLIAICLLSASIAAHGDDKPTTAGRDEIGLREISGEARMAFPPALRSLAGDGAFILDLGECGSLAQSPHMFALRELPHDNSIAVGFCWFDGKGFSKRGVSLERDLGIEAWKLEWKSRGRDATCVAESIAKVGSLLIQDADAPWITRPDEVYELTLTATKVPGALPKTGAIDGGTVHLILTGAKERIVSDTRPKGKRVVEHGRFSSQDLRVEPFRFTTPSGKYLLNLGEADVEEGLVHRYEIEDLPAGYQLQLGFGVQSRQSPTQRLALPMGEFLDQSGIRRLHIHLATSGGRILISEEFDTDKSFRYTLPLNSKVKAANGIVSEGAREGWRFQPNTASGSSFVPSKNAKYVLELMIIEVRDRERQKAVFHPIIRS